MTYPIAAGSFVSRRQPIPVYDDPAITTGIVNGIGKVNKFGYAPSFGTTDGEVYVWDGANSAGINAMTYTFSSTADIDQIVSSSASDTGEAEVQGLDADGVLTVQMVTLTGTTPATLTTPLKRVFRVKNTGASDFVGTITVYINGGSAATATDVRAQVAIGNNQTEMAIYTVPAGKRAILTQMYLGQAGSSKTTNYIFRLKVRSDGGVFQLKHRTSGTFPTPYRHTWNPPEGPYAAGTDLVVTAQLTAAGVTTASVIAGFDLILEDV